MSRFEDYAATSQHYDQTRIPAGVEIIFGCLATLDCPFDRMQVLDAGCGTGNYSQALLKHAGIVRALDINPDMIRIAARKMERFEARGRMSFCRAGIDAIPFRSGLFDAVMVNQVLHHLGDTADSRDAALRRVFSEFKRVLKPKGLLMINTCSHEQVKNGYWFYHLIPEAVERVCQRYPSIDRLTDLIKECGLSMNGRYVALDAMCRGPAYFDARGPLNPEWRDGDSIFALVAEGQLTRVKDEISKMDANGTLVNFVKEHDRARQRIGQTTFVVAERPYTRDMDRFMKEKIARLKCWKAKVDPIPVDGGHTNHNFLVEDQGRKFFVRAGDDLEAHCIMRFNEVAVSRAAFEAGISPRIVWREPGIIVTRYIQGKTMTKQDVAETKNLDRLTCLIRKCHKEIKGLIRGPVLMFWVFHAIRNYAAVLKSKKHRIENSLPGLMDINTRLETSLGSISPVVTHNDLLASNFIDDGEKIWIVDWEYAGFNTALFDLACFCSFCDVPVDKENRVLEAYYQSPVTDALRRRFVALKCASELWTYLWSHVAEMYSSLDLEFNKIAKGHWIRFESAWQVFNQT